jgi:hypothetical protein
MGTGIDCPFRFLAKKLVISHNGWCSVLVEPLFYYGGRQDLVARSPEFAHIFDRMAAGSGQHFVLCYKVYAMRVQNFIII